MRTKWLAAVAVAAFVAAPALAQFGPGFGRGGGAGMLLGNKGVQSELKLTDEQKTKVQEFTTKTREKMREAFQSAAGDREKMQEAFKEIASETEKFVKDTLKPEQQKRLKQIQRQQVGIRAFQEEDVAKALKLTDEQKSDITKLSEDIGAQMREMFQSAQGDPEKMRENRKKIETLNKEAMDKVQKMLTADQKKEWKELTGEPYTVRFEGGPGGPGGGRGGKGKQKQ